MKNKKEKTEQNKLEIMGITIHFSTEKTPEGYTENCQIKYEEKLGADNMAVVYRSIKDFYDGNLK
jgi:hypothetical protein